MGYTHYWNQQPIDSDTWKRIVADIETVIERSNVPVAMDFDDPETPALINDDKIWFNGIGDNGHETFVVKRVYTGSEFCKTARKPYDTLVCAALIILNTHAPECIQVSSDGDADDWSLAYDLVQRYLGDYTLPDLRND